MELRVWGGAGEQGRACFLVRWDGGSCLLDCGVKRVFDASSAGEYPVWDPEMLAEVDAVVVTHAHEDHAAALPMVERLAPRATLFAHPVMIPEIRACARAWISAVRHHGMEPPFGEGDVADLRIQPWSYGAPMKVGGATLTCGPNGHMLGSMWVQIEDANEKRLVFTSDWTSQSLLLPSPSFPTRADALLTDAAYGVHSFSQDQSLTMILDLIADTIACDSVALLPVPRVGRSQELLLALSTELHRSVPLLVEASIVEGLGRFAEHPELLREGAAARLDAFDPARVTLFRGDIDKPSGAAVVLASDGMAMRGPARLLAEKLAPEPGHLVLFVSNQGKGTVGARMLAGTWPGQRASAERVLWKSHPDFEELSASLRTLHPRPLVVLANVEPDLARPLALTLTESGHVVVVPYVGDCLAIP